jgi:hypothetical protein
VSNDSSLTNLLIIDNKLVRETKEPEAFISTDDQLRTIPDLYMTTILSNDEVQLIYRRVLPGCNTVKQGLDRGSRRRSIRLFQLRSKLLNINLLNHQNEFVSGQYFDLITGL